MEGVQRAAKSEADFVRAEQTKYLSVPRVLYVHIDATILYLQKPCTSTSSRGASAWDPRYTL